MPSYADETNVQYGTCRTTTGRYDSVSSSQELSGLTLDPFLSTVISISKMTWQCTLRWKGRRGEAAWGDDNQM